jgi:hypothetical protein
MNWHIQDTHADARKDPRIGIIKIFENANQKIPQQKGRLSHSYQKFMTRAD